MEQTYKLESEYTCPECGRHFYDYKTYEKHMDEELRLFILQSAKGFVDDIDVKYDEDGDLKCINWYDCSQCPIARPECFD